MAREYPTVLDLVGSTPIVRLVSFGTRDGGDAAREARVHEPRRLEQGSHRDLDDRGGRARRAAPAGRDDRRADLGQHRRRARDRRGPQGLPLHLRDARQDEPGEDLDAPRLRRRGRDHARRRSSTTRRRATTRSPTGSPRRSRAGSSPTSTRTTPTRRRTTRRRRRSSGSRPAGRSTRSSSRSARAARSPGSGATSRSASPAVLIVGADPEGSVFTADDDAPGAPVPRRGDRQGHLAGDDGPGGRRRVDPGLRPRLVPHRPPARARGRAARRRLVRLHRLGGARGREAARPRLDGS